MNWAHLAVTAAVNLGLGMYVYGRLTERVKNHGDRLNIAEHKLDNHETRISHLEARHTKVH